MLYRMSLCACELNKATCVCMCVNVCVDVTGASKITFIVQGGHPENIFKEDGTFLGQEALQGEGRARL